MIKQLKETHACLHKQIYRDIETQCDNYYPIDKLKLTTNGFTLSPSSFSSTQLSKLIQYLLYK